MTTAEKKARPTRLKALEMAFMDVAPFGAVVRAETHPSHRRAPHQRRLGMCYMFV